MEKDERVEGFYAPTNTRCVAYPFIETQYSYYMMFYKVRMPHVMLKECVPEYDAYDYYYEMPKNIQDAFLKFPHEILMDASWHDSPRPRNPKPKRTHALVLKKRR